MMYRIIKTDGTLVGITDDLIYIKIGASGKFTMAKEKDAIGIAYKSVPYNLFGHSDIEDAETVLVSKIDGGDEMNSITNTISILLGVNDHE